MKYTKKELEQIREINETLERMEKKLDEAIAIFNQPSKLEVKGYSKKNKMFFDFCFSGARSGFYFLLFSVVGDVLSMCLALTCQRCFLLCVSGPVWSGLAWVWF